MTKFYYSDDPANDEMDYYNALGAHQERFPKCECCGKSLMNVDTIIRLKDNYYCDFCADVLTNDEMREAEGLEE